MAAISDNVVSVKSREILMIETIFAIGDVMLAVVENIITVTEGVIDGAVIILHPIPIDDISAKTIDGSIIKTARQLIILEIEHIVGTR